MITLTTLTDPCNKARFNIYFSQDEKLLAATREKKTKDNILLSLQAKQVEAGSLLAGAEVR